MHGGKFQASGKCFFSEGLNDMDEQAAYKHNIGVILLICFLINEPKFVAKMKKICEYKFLNL